MVLQIAEAAMLRNCANSNNLSSFERRALNQIVHSTDVRGPYANTPNPFRDHTASYDKDAQKILDRANAKCERS